MLRTPVVGEAHARRVGERSAFALLSLACCLDGTPGIKAKIKSTLREGFGGWRLFVHGVPAFLSGQTSCTNVASTALKKVQDFRRPPSFNDISDSHFYPSAYSFGR